MKQILCARPGCDVALTPAQLLKQGRYCSLRCAASAKPAQAHVEGSISDTARQLGIARHTLKQAMATGRYVDGVYTPRRKGKPTQ